MLVLTLLVRDEADVVRLTLEHHLAAGVDVVLAMDNGSIDGTRELLSEYEPGGRVVVLDEPALDYRQWLWVTRMARLAAFELGADWIIHADADEFWWPNGAGDLKDVLDGVPPEYGWVVVHRDNFPPTAGEDAPFFERQVIRDVWSQNALGRTLLGKVCHRADPEVWIAQGNHELQSDVLPLFPGTVPITVLHFPLRTYAQFERKVVLGGRAYARNTELGYGIGESWRRQYEAYLRGELREWYEREIPSPSQLSYGMATGRYVVDPRLERFGRSVELGASPPAPQPRPGPVTRLWRGAADREGGAFVEALPQSPRAHVDAQLEERLVDFVDEAAESLVCAAFDLRATAVAAALNEARRRGVSVRLLHDRAGPRTRGDACDPKPDGADAVLASWQLEPLAQVDACACHHRFIVRDASCVWTGSASFSPGGLHLQDADCAIVHSNGLAAAYLNAFDALTRGPTVCRRDAFGPVALPDGSVSCCFAPGDAIRRSVVSALERAEHIRFMAFALTDPEILTALRRRHEAGADVGGVVDPYGTAAVLQRSPREAEALLFLVSEGVVAAPSSPFDGGREHEFLASKLFVLDDDTVLTGSANFTQDAWESAADLLVIRSPSLAAVYSHYVETVLGLYSYVAATYASAPAL